MGLAIFCSGANADGRHDFQAGCVALNRGDAEEGIRLLTSAIESGDLSAADRATAFDYRGFGWGNKRDYDRAIADFSEAIRLDANYADAFYGRALAWRYKRDYDRAMPDYHEAIRLDPRYARAFKNPRFVSYSRTIAHHDDAIQVNPHDAGALKARGYLHFYNGDFSSAASDLAQSEQLQPNTYSALWLYLARSRTGGDGKAELKLNTNGMDEKKWPAPVVALYLGKTAPDTDTFETVDPDARTDKAQRCEANFYLGEWRLLRDEKFDARTLLNLALNTCPKTSVEYDGAMAELERLK